MLFRKLRPAKIFSKISFVGQTLTISFKGFYRGFCESTFFDLKEFRSNVLFCGLRSTDNESMITNGPNGAKYHRF